MKDHKRRKKSLGPVFEYKKRRRFSAQEVRSLRRRFWNYREKRTGAHATVSLTSVNAVARNFGISPTRTHKVLRDNAYIKHLHELAPKQKATFLKRLQEIRDVRAGLRQPAIAPNATNLSKEYGVGVNAMYRMLHGIDYADLAMPGNSVRQPSRKETLKSRIRKKQR